MSSILDALKKLETEKTEAAPPEEGPFRPELAEQDLLGRDAPAERRPSRISPVVLILGGALAAVGLVVASVSVSLMITRAKPVEVTVARNAVHDAAPAVAPPVQPVTAAPSPATPEAAASRPPPVAPQPLAPTAVVPQPPAPASHEETPPIKIEPTAPAPVPAAAPTPNVQPPPVPVKAVDPVLASAKKSEVAPAPKRETPKPKPVEPKAVQKPEEPKPQVPLKPGPQSLSRTLAPPVPPVSKSESTDETRPAEVVAKREAGPEGQAGVKTPERGLDVLALPVMTETDKVRFGLGDFRVNIVRPATKDRPHGSAIINLQPVQVGEKIEDSKAVLIGVSPRAIGVEIEGTHQRYQVRF